MSQMYNLCLLNIKNLIQKQKICTTFCRSSFVLEIIFYFDVCQDESLLHNFTVPYEYGQSNCVLTGPVGTDGGIFYLFLFIEC